MTIRDDARQEAERQMAEARETVGLTVREQQRYIEGHIAGAVWASEQPDREPSDATLKELAPDLTRPGDMRSDLAYPSDAEVEAAASAMWDRYGPPGMFRYAPEQRQNSFRSDARAALLAAQEVRR